MRVGVRLRGFLSLSVTACFFGLGVVLAKLLTGVFSPVLLACLALGCGGLLVTLLAARHASATAATCLTGDLG